MRAHNSAQHAFKDMCLNRLPNLEAQCQCKGYRQDSGTAMTAKRAREMFRWCPCLADYPNGCVEPALHFGWSILVNRRWVTPYHYAATEHTT
jgi:hypothetical protein